MNLLSVENVSKRFGHKLLFESISFGINKGEKVALIAKNGSGKTTLLKAIAGVEPADGGEINSRNGIRIGYLPQEPVLNNEQTIIQAILSESTPTTDAIESYEMALENPDDQEKLQAALDAMDHNQAWDFEAQIKETLGKLELHDPKTKIGTLSGGQKKRVALAKVLLENPDLIILDEPTNHLDLGMIEWLENYLAKANLSLLMVTHDRYFLERVCNDILELDNGIMYRYKGNYSYYLEKKEEREDIERAGVDKAKNLMRTELEWIRRMPKARGTKSKSRVDAFDDLKDRASKNLAKDDMKLDVKTTRMGGKILELHKINKSYGEKVILEKFNYIFKRGEKVGIVGPNGVGKSTFLKMILGLEQADSGKIVSGETIKFGHYSQDGIQFKEEKRVIDIVKDIAEVIPIGGGNKITAAQFLERFLFPRNMHYNHVSVLSGGEKRRLYLLTVLMDNPNFLILDEPTNDLDIFTLNVLEDYLVSFQGCVIVVTHDRYFMDKLADHLFVFEGEGKIRDFPGNYTQYRDKLSQEETEKKTEQKKNPVLSKSVANEVKNKLTYGEKLEFKKLEKEIEELEEKKNQKAAQLSDVGSDHEKLMTLSAEVEKLVNDINHKTERWMELSEFAE